MGYPSSLLSHRPSTIVPSPHGPASAIVHFRIRTSLAAALAGAPRLAPALCRAHGGRRPPGARPRRRHHVRSGPRPGGRTRPCRGYPVPFARAVDQTARTGGGGRRPAAVERVRVEGVLVAFGPSSSHSGRPRCGPRRPTTAVVQAAGGWAPRRHGPPATPRPSPSRTARRHLVLRHD